MTDLKAVARAAREFAEDRDWEQFHTPKNLTMALAGEAGELAAELQWLTDAEAWAATTTTGAAQDRFAAEMADVLIYLLRLSDITGIDLLAAAQTKLATNAERYPVELSRGTAAKYTDLN